jgi:hypothetical protein
VTREDRLVDKRTSNIRPSSYSFREESIELSTSLIAIPFDLKALSDGLSTGH